MFVEDAKTSKATHFGLGEHLATALPKRHEDLGAVS
jgi:hypothetical protein